MRIRTLLWNGWQLHLLLNQWMLRREVCAALAALCEPCPQVSRFPSTPPLRPSPLYASSTPLFLLCLPVIASTLGAGTVLLVAPNTREVGVFLVKASATQCLGGPFTVESKVHFTLEMTAGFNVSHGTWVTGNPNSQSSPWMKIRKRLWISKKLSSHTWLASSGASKLVLSKLQTFWNYPETLYTDIPDMFPVNTFKKRVTFDFLNSRGSNSMFPFTAESGKDRGLSAYLK